ncbi:hypothetical protein DICPUDRAFT_159298 [Dictyostelium purpureum]|uniref:Conserved oligomeric Golgi complex subunit 3 n=2 Tax=Dictyostelium purpureum TaxID=5786 RepID=F1A3S2_DICPU|nr:uncharacterized protein DICPUDRAFT_159298 [Dictyostelium purpureum]EGC29162.1 hypothetical protein DICPUDRAFT_159298 [Dictyostelium purpureum]|eukprot:XP_003294315.1 hypothetical protein DICPUDRAFT_159298 [Dictyostelium purpureum]
MTTTPTTNNFNQQQHQQQQKINFDVSNWEKKTRLSTDQLLVINNLNKCIQEKPLPDKFIDIELEKSLENTTLENYENDNQQNQPQPPQQKQEEIIIDNINFMNNYKPKKPIDNLSDFYQWYSIIDKNNPHLHQYEWFLETVVNYADGSNQLLSMVENCDKLVEGMQTDYSNLTKKTNQLNEDCEKFFKEELKLRYIAQSIHDKLKFYNQLEVQTKKFNSPNYNVTDPTFLSSLEYLENSINFMKSNPSFMESNKYLLQYGFLFSRGLGLIKDYISSNLRILSKDIMNAQKQLRSNPQQPQQTEKNINSDFSTDFNDLFQHSNIRFKAFAPKIRPLCIELEKRALGTYQSFLIDTENIYFNNRRSILSLIMFEKFQSLTKMSDISSMIRNSSLFMIQFYENEYQTFSLFFSPPENIHECYPFTNLLDEYSHQLYDTLRPVYIHIHSFETLCNLAHLIRNELIDDIVLKSVKYSNGFKNSVERMLQDIQERLIFIIETYIRDEIRTYIPKPEDLDYPNQLKIFNEQNSPMLTSGNSSPSLSYKSIYSTWYPTLEKSLTCLSKLYLVLETKIFEGLAQEVVEACTYTLMRASKMLSQKNEPFIIIDSQLFLIKNLLTLREQIAPFDINFVIIEQIVDFPNLKHSLSTLYNVGSLLTLSSNNPILSLLSPRITNTSIDSKKDLEKELKQSIESFILSTANSVIDPLLSLLTKISVFLNQSIKNQTDPMLLSQQSFADPQRIKEIIEQVKEKSQTFLPDVLSKMKLYLSPSTQTLLVKPIKTNIIDGFDQINQYTKKYYTDEQNNIINLKSLKVILDDIFSTLSSPKLTNNNSNNSNKNNNNNNNIDDNNTTNNNSIEINNNTE